VNPQRTSLGSRKPMLHKPKISLWTGMKGRRRESSSGAKSETTYACRWWSVRVRPSGVSDSGIDA